MENGEKIDVMFSHFSINQHCSRQIDL